MKKVFIILIAMILSVLVSTSALACSPGCGHENLDADYIYQTYICRLEKDGFDFSTWYNESLEYFSSFEFEDKHCQPIFEEDGSVISVRMFTKGTANSIIYYPIMIDGLPCYQNEAGELIYGSHNIIGYKVLNANYKADIFAKYKANIEAGLYYSSNDRHYITTINGIECYQTAEGQLYYGGELIYNNIATLDKLNVNEIIIYQDYNTAITLDHNFIKVYYFGEIIRMINIHAYASSIN